MIFSYSFFLVMILSVIIFLLRSFIIRRKNAPVKLFLEGLRNENSGQYEEAIVTYENALDEVRKNKLHNYLKTKITEKLKVLHTIIEYKKSFQVRKPE